MGGYCTFLLTGAFAFSSLTFPPAPILKRLIFFLRDEIVTEFLRILVTLVLVGGNFLFVGFAIILFAREYRLEKSTSNRAVQVLPSTNTLTTAPITITSAQMGRSKSTVLHAERLHAEHLEHERRLSLNTSQRMEKQRRRTQNRVKARAALRQSQALHKVEIFCDLDDATISALVGEMTYESWPIGTKLVEEGDLADSLFVIMKGNCGVFIKGVKVHVLSKFDVFGENALVSVEGEKSGQDGDEEDVCDKDKSPRQRTRNATVITESEPTQVLKLTQTAFEALVESGKLGGGNGESDVLSRVRAVSVDRTKSNRMLAARRASGTSSSGMDNPGEQAESTAIDMPQDFTLITRQPPPPPLPPGTPPLKS